MSNNPQQPAKASKWSVGSFLQQAVAGVESRLDTILAESDDEGKPVKDESQNPTAQSASRAGKSPAKPTSVAVSRSSSSARTNDRLQERLARAVVKQGGPSANVTSTPSSASALSRTSSPVPVKESRTSVDSIEASTKSDLAQNTLSDIGSASPATRRSEEKARELEEEPGTGSRPSIGSEAGKEVSDEVKDGFQGPIPEIGITAPPSDEVTETDPALAQLQAEHDAAEAQWQAEMHCYLEKIDSLQAKLKYLAKEAAESAKSTAVSAAPGSLEKKLSERDEQIAALMEEGNKLSKTEMEHRTTIKKLRQYIAENTKSQADSKRRMEKMEKDLANMEDKAQRFEQAEKRALSKLNSQTRAEKELEAMTIERDNLRAKLTSADSQLGMAVSRAEAAERKSQLQASEAESRRITELKEDLASAKIEQELSEEKLRREIRDLNETLGREKERGRVQEAELRVELSMLEGKMETLRSKAEEVSSSATGDAQAQLLRQIERLQSQYAVARENWNGIESSLMSRLANVEKERDDIARKEGDLRRKIRETNQKCKRTESELDSSRAAVQELERDLDDARKEMKRVAQKLEKAENDLAAARRDFELQKERQEADWTQRLEAEKSRWHEQLAAAQPYLDHQGESPSASSRRLDSLTIERPSSRRSAAVPSFYPGQTPPLRQSSYSSINSSFGHRHSSQEIPNPLDISPIPTQEPEDYTAGILSPTTPGTHHSRGINDIVSVSTVAAGPSVQLVERMSATVRRLESERAAFKDEMGCITAQRDEARQEVVELMQEVDQKKETDKRVQELEAAVADLNQRYQTTLEMLGEKSELVEEQKADIQDLKKIYRELVESTVK